MPEQPLISIIIPSYTIRRLSDILDLLNSIRSQTYPHIETIVVIERSIMLLKKVKDYARKNGGSTLKIVFNDKPGATSARNSGVSQATGEYLAFIDDDAVLSPDWAAKLAKTYRDMSIVGVTGPILPLWEDGSKSWFPGEFDWVIGCSRWTKSDRITEIRSVLGTNTSFRKEALKLAGLYSLALGARKSEQGEWGVIAEETELSMRVKQKTGGRIVYNPGLTVYHHVAPYKLRSGFIAQRSYQVGRTRRMIKSLGRRTGNDTDILYTEHELLKRILTRLIPGTLFGFFRSPANAWRRLSVMVLALFFVTLGYISYFFSPADTHPKILVEPKGVE